MNAQKESPVAECSEGFEILAIGFAWQMLTEEVAKKGPSLRLLNEQQEQIIIHHLREDDCKACTDTIDSEKVIRAVKCSKGLKGLAIGFAWQLLSDEDFESGPTLRLLNEEQEQIIMRHLKESGCKACKETMDVSLDMADLFFQYKRKLFELFDEVQFGGIRLKEVK